MPYLRNKRTGETVFVPDQGGGPQGGIAPNPLRVQDAQAGIGKTIADTTKIQTDTIGSGLDNQKTIGDIAKQRKELAQNPIGEKDQTFINTMREESSAMPELIGQMQAASTAVGRFKPSATRGALFNNIMPEDDDWLPTALAKTAGRWFTDDKSEEDYQTLRSLQEGQALVKQQAQKGPQTEADTARIKASGVSPSKGAGPNALTLAEGTYNARLAQIKPEFYTKWANNFGSINAPNHEGKTAGEVWGKIYQDGLNKMRQGKGYRAAQSGQRPAPQQSSGGAKFLGWEE